ncbi:MAG: crossover junction endodeoxyribonuclease RuvC [Candidatus Microgenomates bacterium]
MKILSIDCGIEKNGYAIYENKNYLTSGLIKTDKNKNDQIRLKDLYNKLSLIIKKNQPKIIVLEQLFFFKNLKTAIRVSQAQGVIILLSAQKKLPVYYLTPLQVKQAITGYGKADKKSVQKMLKIELGLDIKQDDEADAVALGYSYYLINSTFKR